MGQHGNNGREPSKYQLCKYAVLMVLSESNSGKTLAELEQLTGFKQKDLLNVVKRLIAWHDAKQIKGGSSKKFIILADGKQKLDYFDRTRNYKDYWTPPWKE